MSLIRLAVFVSSLWALPAAAQEQITPDAFLDRAVGKTLTFTNTTSGTLVGTEQFLRRNLSVWALASGKCSYGHIEIRGPLICFIYEEFPNPENCWVPFEDDQGITVLSTFSREIQRVTKITKQPVDCYGAPLS